MELDIIRKKDKADVTGKGSENQCLRPFQHREDGGSDAKAIAVQAWEPEFVKSLCGCLYLQGHIKQHSAVE